MKLGCNKCGWVGSSNDLAYTEAVLYCYCPACGADDNLRAKCGEDGCMLDGYWYPDGDGVGGPVCSIHRGQKLGIHVTEATQ